MSKSIRIPDLSKVRTRGAKTIGVSGVVNYGGFLLESEENVKLLGVEKYKTYSNILANVSIIGAGTRYFLNLVAKPSWRVEPANQTPEAIEAAEFVQTVMDRVNTPWSRIIRRAAMYRFYGFSIQEWTAKRFKDGRIGLKDIAPRPQSTITRWKTDRIGEVQGVWQTDPQNYHEIFLPREKFIYLVDDSINDSPEGLGLFRHIIEPAKRLQRYEELEHIGFETDLRGVPVGKAPFAALQRKVKSSEITQEEADALTKPMRSFMENHIRGNKTALMMDSTPYQTSDEGQKPSTTPLWDIELLKSGITSQDAIYKAIMRITTEIARVLGVEGLLLGGSDRGSLALSKDKSHNFYLIVDSTITELLASYQKDFIGPLWDLNGFDEELKPTLKADVVQFRDVESISRALRDIQTTDMTEEDAALGELFDLLGLSRLLPNRKTKSELHPDTPKVVPTKESRNVSD